MALLWNDPRTWDIKEPITADKLNEMSNNFRYLAQPAHGLVTVRGTGSDVVVATNTPQDLDLATFQLSVELTGVFDVMIRLVGMVANSTVATRTRFDFFIDNAIYASSLSGTQLTEGVWSSTQYVAANFLPVEVDITLPPDVLGAGIHTFQPRMWVTSGSATFKLGAGWFSQFEVREE
jgi:hypothetical protein